MGEKIALDEPPQALVRNTTKKQPVEAVIQINELSETLRAYGLQS